MVLIKGRLERMGLAVKKKISEYLIIAFAFVCVIFPGDIFHLKKVLFLSILLLNWRLLFKSLINTKTSLITFWGFVFPTVLFLYSFLLTSDLLVSFSRSFAAYMILLVFVIKYNVDYEKILIRAISLIVFMTLLLVVMDLTNLINVNTGFFRNNIMYGLGIGLMGKSSNYPFYYKIFFRTSPLIVILLFKSFDQGKYITSFFSLAALVFSGTRANVLFPVFFMIYYYIFCCPKKSPIIKYAYAFVSILIIIIFSSSLLDLVFDAFIIKGQVSDVVRVGHIASIIELVKIDPYIMIRGSGMGSEFYSYGTDGLTSSIEWSYIDLWRQMGFVLFFLFIIFILIPVFYSNPKNKYKKVAYITYLFIAATNPLLFNSTAYLFFIYMYLDLQKKELPQTI